MFAMLEKLAGIPGVSGQEGQVAKEICQLIHGYCDYHIDALGNIIAFKKGQKTPAHKLMLSAHMDEVGLIIVSAEDNGLLKFAPVGGIDKRVFVGKSVMIGQVHGVIGTKALHMKKGDEKEKTPEIDGLYIDIGAKDKEEALSHVNLGDRAVFTSVYTPFGDGFLRGRALDDRAGCVLLIQLIRAQLQYDTWFAFTVQEETGTTGAKTAAYQIAPERAITVETTTACDIPQVKEDKQVCALGKGPVVSFMDKGTVYDMDLYTKAMACAQRNNIPCQAKAGVYGGNESRSVQAAGKGCRVLAVSVPCRYLHTPSCVIKEEDMENTLRLLEALLDEFGA